MSDVDDFRAVLSLCAIQGADPSTELCRLWTARVLKRTPLPVFPGRDDGGINSPNASTMNNFTTNRIELQQSRGGQERGSDMSYYR